jgi:hypothetical protein
LFPLHQPPSRHVGARQQATRSQEEAQVHRQTPHLSRVAIADNWISRSVLGDFITVWVGRGTAAKKFYINSDLAIQHSGFFKAVLETDSKKAEQQTIRLSDLDDNVAATFESFQSFLYAGKVVSSQTNMKPDEDEEWDRLANSWILGNSLLSGSFKDAVVDAMVHKLVLAESVPLDIYTNMYQNSSESSPIRKLMVDIAVHEREEEDMVTVCTDNEPAVQAEFLRDVAVALFRFEHLLKESPVSAKSGCYYHEHGSEKPCYKTMFEKSSDMPLCGLKGLGKTSGLG